MYSCTPDSGRGTLISNSLQRRAAAAVDAGQRTTTVGKRQLSCFEDYAWPRSSATGDEEVAPDAMQLVQIATFNGLCRVIAALAENGMITSGQIENIHDCMTTPLDDEDWRDDAT